MNWTLLVVIVFLEVIPGKLPLSVFFFFFLFAILRARGYSWDLSRGHVAATKSCVVHTRERRIPATLGTLQFDDVWMTTRLSHLIVLRRRPVWISRFAVKTTTFFENILGNPGLQRWSPGFPRMSHQRRIRSRHVTHTRRVKVVVFLSSLFCLCNTYRKDQQVKPCATCLRDKIAPKLRVTRA